MKGNTMHLQSVGGHQVIPLRARKLKAGMVLITDGGYATVTEVTRTKGRYTGEPMYRITLSGKGLEILHEEDTVNTVVMPDWQSTCSSEFRDGVNRLQAGIIPTHLDSDTANKLRRLRAALAQPARSEVSGVL